MGLVLWIDKNTFATSLLEKVFKKRNLEFYTIPNADDFLYLIDDLKPELLVLDSSTALEYREALEKQYAESESLQKLPVIMLDESENLPFVQNIVGRINRPFDPFQIPEKLREIYQAN